ncbi:SPOC domain-containing protein [Apiospora saccharicola]|uniref:SPOC domain-containing protein n=1 Tax=Apiospora saccharicola TaxID=335842 RepID=A0ABR1UZF0_9PEZI
MARDEHPDQIVTDKSPTKPKSSTPAKSKATSTAPASQAVPAVAEGRAAQSTPSALHGDAFFQLDNAAPAGKAEKSAAAANPGQGNASAQNNQGSKTNTPKKSGTKATKQQAQQPATPSKDRKKLPANKKSDTSNKNSAPNNNDGKVLIAGTADYVANNIVEKAQSDALETIMKANEKATEIRKDAEEQAAQVIADAHTQVDEKVKNAGEEASQIIKDSEEQVAQVLAEARQRAQENLDKAKEEAEAIDRDSQLRVGEVVAGARDRAVRADEEAANAMRDIDTATEEIRRGKTTLKNFFEGIAARVAPHHDANAIKDVEPYHELEAAKQVMGPLFGSPTVGTLLGPRLTGRAPWDLVKRCMEKDPKACHDIALLRAMINVEQYSRGHVDLPHHTMQPPARAVSVPQFENKVFKLKTEEADH